MEASFASMKTDMEQLRKRWEQVQSRLVAEVERTNAQNQARLNQAMSDHQAKLDKAWKERDVAERQHRQRQAELGLAQLELAVAKEDVRTARASRDDIMKDNDRLRKELEKKAFSAQANLKRIIECSENRPRWRSRWRQRLLSSHGQNKRRSCRSCGRTKQTGISGDPDFGSWTRQTTKRCRRI
jgi:chromosome segregation ATPase